jgi:hypothetical protein
VEGIVKIDETVLVLGPDTLSKCPLDGARDVKKASSACCHQLDLMQLSLSVQAFLVLVPFAAKHIR